MRKSLAKSIFLAPDESIVSIISCMILGLSTEAFTAFHVILSLVGIGSGIVILVGLLGGRLNSFWTGVFLATTILTSLTGFAFPNAHITPGIVLGILSLVALAFAVAALYLFHLEGGWGRTYVISACIALYFNVFVLVAQLFKHVPFLTALDPKQSGPPFAVAQLLTLGIFIWLTIAAVRGFKSYSGWAPVVRGRSSRTPGQSSN
jgi:hypothetical protein